MRLKEFAFAAMTVLTGCSLAWAGDIALEHRKDNAAADAGEIIEMRSNLARSFIRPGAEVTEETFKKVCGAVGKRVKEMAEKEGVRIRHASLRNRNPANAATPEEAALIGRFEAEKGIKDLWDEVERDGVRYGRYTRPIYVEEACLACHGEKDSRPKFITEKYPDDRAYGFKKGDLRGIISVVFPVD